MISMLGKSRITITQKLGESLAAEVFLAKDEARAKPVVVKKIRPEFVSEDIVEHIEHQRAYLLKLNIRQMIVPELYFDNYGSLLLISPFFNGRVLSKWLEERKKIDTVTLLEIGIALADCLAVRHGAALIHKGVKPANILIQNNPVRIRLIDDIRISASSQFSRFAQDNQYRRGTLPYLAPEQTGRIRFYADYSSDLYALGIILYECATGKPPFLSDDPLSVIHSHLAKVPAPVSEFNPDFPEIISDIIAVLLEKAPERRYHSAKGLKADLQTCLYLQQKTEKDTLVPKVSAFVLKQKDFCCQISIPSIMVGREQQKNRLLDEYQRVCTGKLGIATISGLSGMGKTRLIQELERPIVWQGGYYTSGKFNQYNKHLPYATLVESFGRLIRQLLTEDVKRIKYWRKQILDATGENGRLLVDLLPELVHLIGEQPDVPPLPPVEAKNRFNNLSCQFIASFASAQHPLVLFMDDMQWCDSATFDLLDLIIARPLDFPYLFIIGAYRSNEVDEDCRVVQMENSIKASFLPLVKLHIDSLDQDSVNEMIAFILNTSKSRTRGLTDIIYPVSAGNPLFVNESLRWLHNNNRLFFSAEGDWVWDAYDLAGLQLPSSAKALFYDKLKQFPVNGTNLLSIAAMLGTRFEAKDLALAAQISLQKLHALFHDMFVWRILVQDKSTISFFHDQIQAAAAAFLNDEQKRACHRKIARVFIDQLQEKENQKGNTEASSGRLFSIVEHLSAGHRADAGEAELYEEAKFNFRAGMAAMDALALNACDHYLSQSAKLFPDSMWQDDYDFMFILYKKLARASLVNGDQKRSKKIVDIALEHAQSNLDRAECLYEQTVAYASMGDLSGSIESGRRALELIGENLPVSENEIKMELSHLVEELHGNNRNIYQEVFAAPLINDRRVALELHLYAEIFSSCYASGQVLMLTLLALIIIKKASEKGVGDFTVFAMSVTGLYFSMQENYQLANCYEDTMLKMTERFPDTFGSVRALASANWFLSHSRSSVFDLLLFCQKTMDSGIKCGELQYAGLANCALLWFKFVQGKNLHDLRSEINDLVSFSQKNNLSLSFGIGETLQMSLEGLLPQGPTLFDKSGILARLNSWKKEKHTASLGCYFTFQGIVAFYTGNYFQAEQFLDEGEIYLTGITNTIVFRLWYLFQYLTGLQTGKKINIDEYLKKVTNWAAQGPILKPYLGLMHAEAAALQNDLKQTRIAYLDAIDLAHKEEYLFLEAFLNERLGNYLEKENHFSAVHYRNTAILLYQECGALNKVVQIDKPGLLRSGKVLFKKEQKTKTDQGQTLDKTFDYSYLLNSVKVITGELDFNKLLKIIMESVMARLGGKTGYLLIAEKESLVPYVSGIKEEEIILKIKGDPEFFTSKLSMGIARYVFRTKKMLLLNDAGADGNFISDEVVQKENLRSVLCLPLIMQKQALGVLYIENSLIKSVFSDEQVALTGLLTAQAAVAIKNAGLMEEMKKAECELIKYRNHLETLVKERTRDIDKVNEELKTFAYAVSHDLKAPLRGIMQLSSWLTDDYNDQIDKDGCEFLDLIQKRARQMYDMIEGILQYSRVGRIKELSVPVDLNRLIKEAADLVVIPEFITFKIKGILPVIKCEETLLFQIFQNFIDNAVKYMDKEKGEINVSFIEKEAVWQFCVADNGPGIEEKYQKKVFKMFQTLKPKDETDSTGIGLALVQKIINKWGGEICLESAAGEGSRFFFTIPKDRK